MYENPELQTLGPYRTPSTSVVAKYSKTLSGGEKSLIRFSYLKKARLRVSRSSRFQPGVDCMSTLASAAVH